MADGIATLRLVHTTPGLGWDLGIGIYHSRHGISVDLTTAYVRHSQIYCKNKRSDTASCSIRTLIFAVKNDDSAAAVFGIGCTQASSFSSWCLCRAPPATRKGNAHFHCSALVAPCATLRRLTGSYGEIRGKTVGNSMPWAIYLCSK